MNKKITVGLMMVLRNEKNRIRECLDWHLPFVDCVAICDQESDDGTWEILKEYKEKSLVPFNLIGDKQWGFCEPSKQKTADLLKCDWILYVDADEKFHETFLNEMHLICNNDKVDGFMFPRDNFFKVQVFDDNVPIDPKFVIAKHPAKDPQLRLTRKSLSVFPEYLHHRVRINRADGNRYFWTLPYPIYHEKIFTEQWEDNKRYKIVNNKGKAEINV